VRAPRADAHVSGRGVPVVAFGISRADAARSQLRLADDPRAVRSDLDPRERGSRRPVRRGYVHDVAITIAGLGADRDGSGHGLEAQGGDAALEARIGAQPENGNLPSGGSAGESGFALQPGAKPREPR